MNNVLWMAMPFICVPVLMFIKRRKPSHRVTRKDNNE
jgi:hypothetical protein